MQGRPVRAQFGTHPWIGRAGTFLCAGCSQRRTGFLKKAQDILSAKKPGKGRTPIKLQANETSTRLDEYVKTLKKEDWEKEQIRKTAKGWLKLEVHTAEIWVWDGEEPNVRKRILVITRTKNKKPKIKYSFSNGGIDAFTPKEYAVFQTQRYWIEHTFDDAKNELGMSGYQIQKWAAWHHHISLVMLASTFLLREKMDYEA